jgi:hypothetical protein
VKVTRIAETLSNNPGTDDLSVLHDKLAIGFVGKQCLREPGNDEWIDDSQ